MFFIQINLLDLLYGYINVLTFFFFKKKKIILVYLIQKNVKYFFKEILGT